MKQRIITAICMIAVAFPVLIYGGLPFKVLVIFAGIVANYELVKLLNVDKKWPIVFSLSLYPIMIASLFAYNYTGITGYVVMQIFTLVYLFIWLEFNKNVTFEQIGIIFIIQSLMGLTCSGIWKFYEVNKILMFYMLTATVLTDSFALFGGKAFGKHKFNERISPNKTIEGCICGYLAGALGSFVVGYLFIKNVNIYCLIAGSVIMPFTGQIGDLAFSALKRHFGIKDFGNIFPGHGGILDRLDSISFNSMVLFGILSILL